MTNEELKKKNEGILKEAMKPIEYGGDIEHAPEVHYPTEDEIADSLIGAVIGDVLGHRVFVSKDGKEIKQLYNDKEVEQIVKERNMYKRRAEVAERAVENLVRARNYLAAQIYIEVENGDALTVDYYMRQAERQLAKEEENGND